MDAPGEDAGSGTGERVPVVIGRAMVDQIEHARSGFPNEACGLIATKGNRAVAGVPLENARRQVRFTTAWTQGTAAGDAGDRRPGVGTWAQSPTRTSDARVSVSDRRALGVLPGCLYLIVSLAGMTPIQSYGRFKIQGEQVEEVPLD